MKKETRANGMLMNYRNAAFLFVLSGLLFVDHANAQTLAPERDACGLPDTTTVEYKKAASIGWGYGYDTLRYDLQQWKKSPFVTVDSIGTTVQNRTMYMVTIQDTTLIFEPRIRIWIHARTHPIEVQGTWVTNEIIKILLANTPFAQRLRDSCVFNIVPMYNPDGVELGNARENANGIDIESNWSTTPSQPEVNVLRNTFTRLMAKENPIRIALNMHSAYGTSRYFVYHPATGTSALYSAMEVRFIDTVRSNFPGGIEPYTFFESWTTTAATQYPESWFWYNHHENVLALTYEDMNDASANSFDKTANAILHGIGGYLGILDGVSSIAANTQLPAGFALLQNYPNPFNPLTTITFLLPKEEHVTLTVHDLLGRTVAVLVDETKEAGEHRVQWNAASLSSGSYVYTLRVGTAMISKALVVMK